MKLSRRQQERLAGWIGIALWGVCIGGFAIAESNNYKKETSAAMSAEAGFDVIDVQGAKLSQSNENFKATINCIHKESGESIVIEYKLTSTDFIVMNQPESNTWDYLSKYIIPNQDPIFVGTTKEYKEYLKKAEQTEASSSSDEQYYQPMQ